MRKLGVMFTMIYMIIVYICQYTFKDYESLHMVLGIFVYPLVGASISSLWIFQSLRFIHGKQKYVWILLALGNFSFIIAQGIWFFQIKHYKIAPYPSLADFIWITQYLLYLVAVIIVISMIKGASLIRFISNIAIFMTTAITLSAHFIIIPIIKSPSDSIWDVTFSLAYPIIDLTLLFVAIGLFYLSKYSVNKKILTFITFAFALQIFADTAHTYLLSKGKYIPGGVIDPLWILPLLMIGLAALYARDYSDEAVNTVFITKHEYNILPYLGAFVLLIALVLQKGIHTVGSLGIGLFLVMLMITIRQITMQMVNRNLLQRLLIKNEKLAESEEKMKHMAFFDELTDLPNRALFHRHIKEMIEQAKKQNSQIAVMFIDLDRFKFINDSMGHSFGDLFLKKVSKRMAQILGDDGTVYRFGGDEFCVLIELIELNQAVLAAQKMIEGFTKTFWIENRELYSTPSIGISFYPKDGEDEDSLIKHADIAMYKAKNLGGNNFQLYAAELELKNSNKMEMENAIRKAILNKEFFIHYQPKMNLNNGELIGLEALIRWKHQDWGLISPLQFISIAEETGLIIPIGTWVLQEACRQLKEWHLDGFSTLCMAVNISPRQFQDEYFIKMIKNVLQDIQLDPKYLQIEITESIMNNSNESFHILSELKQLGVKISIDDFGTGYSSFSYLKNLPIDEIKIDKSFVDDIPANQKDNAIVKTIIDMGYHLQVNVTAEGIETEQQYLTLKQHRCHVGQGFFFSKPLPPDEVKKLFN